MFTCLLLLNNGHVHAQSSENISPAITSVYGSYVPQITAKQLVWLNSQIERSEVKPLNRKPGEQIPLLSTIPLMNKFVSNLQGDDFTQQPLKINPLKYMINFTATEDQSFRIDGTDYVLFVKGNK